MKTIGILGGLGPESTAAYYSQVTRGYYALRNDYAYPEIVVYSLNFQEIIDVNYHAPGRVKEAIDSLACAGADFVVAACNSIHVIYDDVRDELPIPWVSIMDATAEEIVRAGLSKVALLGTALTMSDGFYQRAFARLGLQTVTPDAQTQARINDIIFSELVTATVTAESKQFVLGCVEHLVEAGAEALVLGCTELPFLVRQEDLAVRVFDTVAIHVKAALAFAMSVESPE